MADRRRVTASTPRGPFVVEVSALLPQTDLSVEVAPAADSEEPQLESPERSCAAQRTGWARIAAAGVL